MPSDSRSLVALLTLTVASSALAQAPLHLPTRPNLPDAGVPLALQRSAGERKIIPTYPSIAPPPPSAPIAPSTSAKTAGKKGPSCEEIRQHARFGIYFDKVDIEKLVQTVSDATCKTFILPENVKGKVSIIGPENGQVEVNADAFYAAFLAALDSNGLTVYPMGNFLKIVEKKGSKGEPIPTFLSGEEEYPLNEQMITKIFKLKYTDVDPVRGIISQLVSRDGDATPFPPDTLIVHDTGLNMHRLETVIHQLDTKSTSDEIRVIQLKRASAVDISATIQKLFESKNPRTNRPGGSGVTLPGQPAPSEGAGSGGPVTLTQVIPDERTNKIILIASPAAFERIEALIREVDVPISGEGRINVYYLANANAEEMAATLQGLVQGGVGSGSSTRRNNNNPNIPAVPGAPPSAPRAPTSGTAELLAGDVKISPDKATNSLVIVGSQTDYRSIARVIEKLDIPRRQVFVEAVIMEVNLDRTKTFGIALHEGAGVKTGAGTLPGIVATKYTTSGLPPSFSLANLASYGGFLAGIQGPVIPALKSVLGIDIPSFGLVLHALQQSSDVNVISTPHLLTSDNEEAEITVGQNVPFQAGFQPSALGATTGTTGTTGSLGTSLLGGLGGLGSLYAPINRQNVELKLTIKPQINESDFIRMVLTEQTEEIASTDPVLGPTTSKRSAKTTVVARDQETVVIGGIMQERTIESVSKVPLLGDIPILGQLFRDSSHHVVKTNLLLFLTPYIIRDQSDFRRIFERKVKERQQFVEAFYGQVAGYDVPVDFSRKAGPVAKLYRAVLREEAKAENGGPGLPGEQVIRPQGPTLPSQVPIDPNAAPLTAVPAGAAPGTAPAPLVQPGTVSPGQQLPTGQPTPVPTPTVAQPVPGSKSPSADAISPGPSASLPRPPADSPSFPPVDSVGPTTPGAQLNSNPSDASNGAPAVHPVPLDVHPTP